MTINLTVPNLSELKPRITVFGVGGAGGNAVNNMIESGLEGVEFVIANTDAQAMQHNAAQRRIQMGTALTQGLGAGSQPQVGAAAAEEALPEIMDHLAGAHMVFITAGMGGGTGTGAAPVIARASKEQGILTVGVVTKPFHFEGQRRMISAERGIEQLAKNVDTLIVIPNQNLFRVANEKTTFAAAFAMADQVLYSGVASITELMTKEGLINLDFADVRAIMSEMGKAMMGTGEATGEKRAIEAAEAAISNPLLDDVSMRGARGLLISITGGPDLTLVRSGRGGNAHSRGSRSGSQYHSRGDVRRYTGRHDAGLGGRHRIIPGGAFKVRERKHRRGHIGDGAAKAGGALWVHRQTAGPGEAADRTQRQSKSQTGGGIRATRELRRSRLWRKPWRAGDAGGFRGQRLRGPA